MKQIPLSNGQFATVDDEDYDLVARFSWTVSIRRHTSYATAYGGGGRKAAVRIYLHRLIMAPPFGIEVDHINHDGLDCRRSNLRLCSRSQNFMNKRKH